MDYRYQFSRSLQNIYKAIKYGIWSFPNVEVFATQFFKFENIQKSMRPKRMYYALCCSEQDKMYLYGIAEVVGFEPRSMFRYWTPAFKGGRFWGIVRLKFVAIGKVAIDRK